MNRLCCVCKQEIPAARLEVLPNTKNCVKCSSVKPYRGIINGSHAHKGYELEIVNADDLVVQYYDSQMERFKSKGQSND